MLGVERIADVYICIIGGSLHDMTLFCITGVLAGFTRFDQVP